MERNIIKILSLHPSLTAVGGEMKYIVFKNKNGPIHIRGSVREGILICTFPSAALEAGTPRKDT